MNEIVDLPEEIGGRLQQLRDRLNELEREASEEDELADRLEHLAFLLDDLERQADEEEERAFAEDEQRRLAEAKLHRLQSILDDLDRQVAAETYTRHMTSDDLSASSDDAALGNAPTSLSPLELSQPALPLLHIASTSHPGADSPVNGAVDARQSQPLSIIISVAVLGAVAALVLLLSGIFNSPTQGASKAPIASGEVGFTGVVLDGRNLFQQHCVSCHGAEGNLLPANPLMSKAYLIKLDDDSLAKTISDGRGTMPAWGLGRGGTLGNDQIDSVISYLRYTSNTPRTKPPMSAQVKLGLDVYQKNCANCHGAKGNRIPATPLDSSDFLAQLGEERVVSAVANGKGSMPAFGSPKTGSLSSDQVAAVDAYLRYASGSSDKVTGSTTSAQPSPQPAAPQAQGPVTAGSAAAGASAAGKDFYAKSCQGCHGAKGDQFPGVKLFDKQYLDSRGDPSLAKTIAQGKGGMPGFGAALADPDIKALISYLRSQ